MTGRFRWLRALVPPFDMWPQFPKKVEDLWLCGKWVDVRMKGAVTCLMPYFNYSSLVDEDALPRYADHFVGEIVPLYFDGLDVAYYSITRIRRSHGDLAEYDDGRFYELKRGGVRRLSAYQVRLLAINVTPTKEDVVSA